MPGSGNTNIDIHLKTGKNTSERLQALTLAVRELQQKSFTRLGKLSGQAYYGVSGAYLQEIISGMAEVLSQISGNQTISQDRIEQISGSCSILSTQMGDFRGQINTQIFQMQNTLTTFSGQLSSVSELSSDITDSVMGQISGTIDQSVQDTIQNQMLSTIQQTIQQNTSAVVSSQVQQALSGSVVDVVNKSLGLTGDLSFNDILEKVIQLDSRI